MKTSPLLDYRAATPHEKLSEFTVVYLANLTARAQVAPAIAPESLTAAGGDSMRGAWEPYQRREHNKPAFRLPITNAD